MRLMRASPAKHALLVEMLRRYADVWTPTEVTQLILGMTDLADDMVDSLARYVAEQPTLWTVSDDEFIAAVREINPHSARLLDSHAGLQLLHRMSAALAARRLRQAVSGLFGRG